MLEIPFVIPKNFGLLMEKRETKTNISVSSSDHKNYFRKNNVWNYFFMRHGQKADMMRIFECFSFFIPVESGHEGQILNFELSINFANRINEPIYIFASLHQMISYYWKNRCNFLKCQAFSSFIGYYFFTRFLFFFIVLRSALPRCRYD
jgi:hypothetical protein